MACSACGARRRVRVAQAAARQALIQQQRKAQKDPLKPAPQVVQTTTPEAPKSEPETTNGPDIQGSEGATS